MNNDRDDKIGAVIGALMVLAIIGLIGAWAYLSASVQNAKN